MLVLPAMAAAACQDGLDGGDEVGAREEAIVNGRMTSDFPATGMLMTGATPAGAAIVCTATLIGCDTVLTAAHCVCDGTGADCSSTVPAAPMHVFFPHAGFFAVSSVHVDPTYNDVLEHDAAVLRLEQPVTGVRPVAISSRSIAPDTAATIVGYGRSGGEERDYGLKREGGVKTRLCGGEDATGKLCWLFDGSAGSSDSNICHGDSGGSTYVMNGDELEIIGVHSTTNQASCLETSTYASADTAVYDHRQFITDMAVGGLAQSTCGEVPQVGQKAVTAFADGGDLSVGETQHHEIEVPRGTAELRVAMNSSDRVGSNLDLFLKSGESADPAWNDCAAEGSSAHGYCQIDSPLGGTWFASVLSNGTSEVGGEYQLTVTMIPGAPIAGDDAYEVDGGEITVAAADGLLVNDEATDRGLLSASLDVPPEHGAVTISADGSFTYSAEAGYSGTDTFVYRASDGTYQGAAVVTLTVATEGGGGGCAAGGRSSSGVAAILFAAAALLARRRRVIAQ